MLSDALLTAPAEVLVLPMTEDLRFAVRTATVFREAGIRTQLYTEHKKFKAKMSYADRLGFPFAAIIGEDELAAGKVALKNMRTGAQTLLTPESAASAVREALAAISGGTVIRD